MKSLLIVLAMGALGGAVVLGLTQSTEVRGEAAGQEAMALSETYTHPELGFSFRYPRGYVVGEIPHGDRAEMVLVEDSARAGHGFQVFTMPYESDESLTPEQIRQEAPTMEHAAPMPVAGVPGLSFVQLQDPALGKTYEVWFVHGGTLYEVATYAARAADLNAILSTWTFRP